MKISRPPNCDYDTDLARWLLRLSVQANQEAGVLLVDVGNSLIQANSPLWIGSYCVAGSSSSAPGYIGFNRHPVTGDILNASYYAYQLANSAGTL